jgi:hypothetical protein
MPDYRFLGFGMADDSTVPFYKRVSRYLSGETSVRPTLWTGTIFGLLGIYLSDRNGQYKASNCRACSF